MAGVTAAISCNRVSKRVKLQNRAMKSLKLAALREKAAPAVASARECHYKTATFAALAASYEYQPDVLRGNSASRADGSKPEAARRLPVRQLR